MQLKTYLIYCLILYLVLVIRTLLYIEKEKTRRAEKKGRTKQKEREPWRRMPPTSRPFLASPSAPSDVFTIHTIDSRSHLTTSNHHRRDGRPPRPLLGDAISTPRHRSTSSKRPQGIASGCLSSILPRPLPCPPLLYVALTVHALARSSIPSSSAVPVILRPDLVRSLSSVRPSVFLFLVPRSPSCRLTAKPTPAAHYLTSAHPRHGWKGSPGSGRDTIATTSPPTSNRDGRTSARPSDRLSLPVW